MEKQYETAQAKLEYITGCKEVMVRVLDRLTKAENCNMYVSAHHYKATVSCLEEIIDELFHDESYQAKRVIESSDRSYTMSTNQERRPAMGGL